MRRRLFFPVACGCFVVLVALAGLLLLALREPGQPLDAGQAAVASLGGSPEARLIAAARSGDAAAVRRLVAAGADPSRPAPGNGWTPLLHAVHTRSGAGARALLASGADPNRRGAGGQLPLLMASAYGDAAMIEVLLDGGADPHLAGQGWRNALEAALTGSLDLDGLTFSRCQPAAVQALLERSPDLVAGGPLGRLGRFFAYARGCEEVERLLERPPAVRLGPVG